jgi:lactate dehydrogenase-like 2-hydroxyacid dehydrogenase
MPMSAKKRIVIANRDVLPGMIDALREEFDVSLTLDPKHKDRESFAEAIQSAHGLICSMMKIGEEQLSNANNLQVVASVSVGYDNYDLGYLTNRGILLTNTPDVLTEATADTGLALIMASARRVVELDSFTRQGLWKRSIEPELFGTNVYGKQLGIIGFGRIGQAVARRGYYGFGMKVLYNSTSPRPEAAIPLQATFCELDALLSQADIICVTVPLTPKTEHLIGEREFHLLRPGTIFVNIARGKVVDQDALIKILQEGKIRAGIDVFEREPLPADSPLISLSNVVLTPHIGSATRETRKAMAELAIQNMRTALSGKRPPNLVNVQAWEQRHIQATTP